MKARRTWPYIVVAICIGAAWWFIDYSFGLGSSVHARRKSGCLSAMRGFSMACLMYSYDADGRTVPADVPWVDNIQAYNDSGAPEFCPELSFPVEGKNSGFGDVEHYGYGYAFNKFLAGAQIDKISDPNKEPILYETTVLGKSVWGYLADIPSPGRHAGMNMFAFADGHATGIKKGIEDGAFSGR